MDVGLDWGLVRVAGLGQPELNALLPLAQMPMPTPPAASTPETLLPGRAADIAPHPALVAEVAQLLASVDVSYLCALRRRCDGAAARGRRSAPRRVCARWR